jgi:hypothetical protein
MKNRNILISKYLLISLFILGSFFVFRIGKASAATVNVSNSATDGYGTCSDAYTYAQATNADLQHPYCTLTQATSAAVSNGDTILVHGKAIGSELIYSEASHVAPARTNLIINCTVDYGCIIRGGGATTEVIYQGTAATGLTLGKIVLDANSTNSYCINQGGGTINDVTFNGTKFLNPTVSFTQFDATANNVTFNTGWIATATNTNITNGFYIRQATGGAVAINKGTMTISGGTNATFYAFYFRAAANGTYTLGEATVTNRVTVNWTIGAGATTADAVRSRGAAGSPLTVRNVDFNMISSGSNIVNGINVVTTGHSAYDIYGNTIVVSNTTGIVHGVAIPNDPANNTTSHCYVYNNTVTLPTTINAGSVLIYIGDDSAPVHRDIINDIQVYGNTASNSNHGIALGYVTSGKVYNNKISNVTIGVLGKHTTSGIYYYNWINGGSLNSGGLYPKASTGDRFYNNIVIANTAGSVGIYIGPDTQNTTGAVFKNNIIYAASNVFNHYVQGTDANQTATFSNNIYYNTGGLPTTGWVYGGNNYTTLVFWLALGVDVASLNTDPLFVSSSDFHLTNTSPAINAGTNSAWSGIANVTDYEGINPITNGAGTIVASGGTVDIGAYEFQDSAAPTTTASPAHGLYNSTQSVTLSCTDGTGVGCDLTKTYYTTDGSDPTISGTRINYSYTPTPAVITVSSSETLKFYSTDKSNNAEAVKSEAYTIDISPPALNITSPASGAHVNSNATIVFTDDDPHSPLCSPDNSNWTACVSNTTKLTDLTGWGSVAEGAFTLYVKDTDPANNTGSANVSLTKDLTSPTVTDVTSTTNNGSYKSGSAINVRVTFSKNVNITNTPRIKLQTNNGNQYATYSTGSGTQNIDFTYTVEAGDTASDLDYVNTTSLELNGGTIEDAATNNATLTLPTPSAAHSLGNNKNIVLDTAIPTLSNLEPNNQTFSVTTTSTNLTLSTSEKATCKYSTTSGTNFSTMTPFDTTNDDTHNHSTFISNLNSGTNYDYYIKCQDTATNESTQGHLTFSIAPEEQGLSLNTVEVKIGRTWNKFKDTIHSAENKIKLRSQDPALANGTVQIYKNGDLWKTITADAQGFWEKSINIANGKNPMIKLKFFDSYGTLLDSQKEKIAVDTEDPTFTLFPPENKVVYLNYTQDENRALVFKAKDNEKIQKYKIHFNGKIKNRKVNDSSQDKIQSYLVPKNTPEGIYTFKVTAYDEAGNKGRREVSVNVR